MGVCSCTGILVLSVPVPPIFMCFVNLSCNDSKQHLIGELRHRQTPVICVRTRKPDRPFLREHTPTTVLITGEFGSPSSPRSYVCVRNTVSSISTPYLSTQVCRVAGAARVSVCSCLRWCLLLLRTLKTQKNTSREITPPRRGSNPGSLVCKAKTLSTIPCEAHIIW